MSKTPLVTIGLPVFNGEEFLRECLDSIVSQTYRDIEIVISDNASTDRTVPICEEYASRDPRVILLRNSENRGSAWNHNRVLEAARGEYFKWSGADDVIKPAFVEATVNALQSRPDASLAFPLTIVIDDNGLETTRTSNRLPFGSPDPVERFRPFLAPISNLHNVFYGLMRTNVLRWCRPMGAFLAADRCLMGEMSLTGPFVQVEEFLMLRRFHAGHMNRTQQDEQRIYRPKDASKFRSREWTVLREAVRSTLRSTLGFGKKARLLAAITASAASRSRELAVEVKDMAVSAARRRRPTGDFGV